MKRDVQEMTTAWLDGDVVVVWVGPADDGWGIYPANGQAQWADTRAKAESVAAALAGGVDMSPTTSLEDMKAQAMAAIDAEVDEAIARGFTWRGKVFSLSTEAQVKWARLDAKKDAFPYPIVVNTADDAEAVILSGAADVTEATSAADATVFRLLQAGALAKASVRAANDEAGVELALLSVGPALGKAAIAPATRSWTDWLFWWRS